MHWHHHRKEIGACGAALINSIACGGHGFVGQDEIRGLHVDMHFMDML